MKGIVSVAQNIGDRVWTPPASGTFFSMANTNFPPKPYLEFDPSETPVFFLGTNGAGIAGYACDDRTVDYGSLSSQGRSYSTSSSESPGVPGGDDSGGGDSDPPSYGPVDYGANLFIMIGPTTNHQASLSLSNTHSGTYYQILGGIQLPASSWELGEIRLASSSLTAFTNVRTDDPTTKFFRGVGGDTVASVYLDPDYNLAVESATNGGSGQIGKFRISLNPAPASARTVVYQISGTASNGVDYTNLSGTVSVSSSGQAEVVVQPYYDGIPEFYENLTLTLVLTNGYLVNPALFSATMQIYDARPAEMAVAILDSGWSKLWWTNSAWQYFTLPEAMKEALRSDGTPFAVLTDLDIKNGALLTTNGLPKYPILISLANEVILDDEIAPLTNYVAAGGFIFAGSSAFTRATNGAFRTNFALASQMGLSCNPSPTNWLANSFLLKVLDHPLLDHLPAQSLVWRMPNNSDEENWGTCVEGFNYRAPHPIWRASTNSGVQVLAIGDFTNGSPPYVTAKPFGLGYFLYDAAMQPLICNGGNGPGMSAYLVFRHAIEWAFQTAQRPVVKLSPWPYQYDAAYMVRHDLENYVPEISHVSESALYENSYGAKGDYYFCTGAITNQSNFAAILAGLRTAVSNGATIASHNGGLPNPNLGATGCSYGVDDYNYFHWGPDEALDHPYGFTYASNSVAISFAQIDGWLTNQSVDPRVWVAPFFNCTREDSYRIEEGLSVKIAGEQKVGPFPHRNLSTRTDGKRYAFVSEPVSDWFVDSGSLSEVAQVVGPWQDHTSGSGVHNSDTLHNAVDFYYANGFLLNFYSHSLSASTGSDPGGAVSLMGDYVAYCANAALHPKIWPSNARDIYSWWLKRSTAQVTGSYDTNGTRSVANITIAGAQDTNTTVELLASGFGSAVVYQLRTNGTAASASDYRASGELIKVRVGTTVTNVQIEYFAGPVARDDFYFANQGQALTVSSASGVLSNDWSGSWSGLIALTNSIPQHGSLAWNNNGGFTYTSSTNGTECFTYHATDGVYDFGVANVTLMVTKSGSLFSDDFNRCTMGSFYPWQVHSGSWSVGAGAVQGIGSGDYANAYIGSVWTNSNYSVEAQVQISSAACGGGLGARINTSTGAHYAAWLYPSGSDCGANHLALIKFSTWQSWGYNGSSLTPMAQTNLAVGSGWHPLKLICSNSVIQVYYHGTNVISMVDTNAPIYSTNGVSLDVFNGTLSISNLIVAPVP